MRWCASLRSDVFVRGRKDAEALVDWRLGTFDSQKLICSASWFDDVSEGLHRSQS